MNNLNKTNNDMIKTTITQLDSGMFINPEEYNVVGVKNDDLESQALESSFVGGILHSYLRQIEWQRNQGHLTEIEYHKATSYLVQSFSRDFRDDVAEIYKNEINRLTKHYWNSRSGKWEPFKDEKTHEYALINVHPSTYTVKKNKNGSKSVKWKQGGKAYKEIQSFNIKKADSYVVLANQIADLEQEEALDVLEKSLVLNGYAGTEGRKKALEIYNEIMESKVTIDTYSNNRGSDRYSEWTDVQRQEANELYKAFGLKTNEEIFKELNPYRLRQSFKRITSLIALYQLLLGSETLASNEYRGSMHLSDTVCWKKNNISSSSTDTALVL
mgnify:CR=1 FL=1